MLHIQTDNLAIEAQQLRTFRLKNGKNPTAIDANLARLIYCWLDEVCVKSARRDICMHVLFQQVYRLLVYSAVGFFSGPETFFS